MLAMTRRAMRRTGNWVSGVWREWMADWWWRRHLSRLSDRETDSVLADAGLSRSDLPVVLRSECGRRRLMIRTMIHFKVDPKAAALRYWGAFRDAERVCIQCGNVRRCRRWHLWGRHNDAPRVFCPNAQLFDDMARDRRAP